MNKKTIIEQLINDGHSATYASMLAEVEQKQLKRGNPLANSRVTKLVQYRMLLNANYQNMVNNQREREGKEANFEAKENWFKKVNDGFNGSIVCNKSNENSYYLLFACDDSKTEKYFIDGVEATPQQIETIKQFRPKPSSSSRQGLQNEIIVRTVKLDGIKEIKCGAKVIF